MKTNKPARLEKPTARKRTTTKPEHDWSPGETLNPRLDIVFKLLFSRYPRCLKKQLYYWARSHNAQIARGGKYRTLQPTVGIFFLDFNELAGERFHSIFRLFEIHSLQPLTDALELHVLELPKLPKGPPDAETDPVLHWCQFLAAETDEEREHLAMIDPQMLEAKTALEQLSQDRMAQELAFDRQLEINSYRDELQFAKQLAMEEGKAKGRAEGRAEGEAKGRAEALVETIEQLCQACGIELTTDRRATMEAASLDELRRIINTVAVDRAWPG